MGNYINAGNVLFKESLNSNIYVDKTRLIHFTNECLDSKNKLICVSRPRRFGKSMALEMLAAYYTKGCDSRELFEDLKVCRYDENKTEKINRQQAERFEKNLNAYDVILIDMQGALECAVENDAAQRELFTFYQEFGKMGDSEKKGILHPRLVLMQKYIIKDIYENSEYGQYISKEESSLGNALLDIYNHTGNKFIILIDEWDCIFRNYEDDKFFQDKYIDWLRGMFKNTSRLPMFALVYMTGILPIKRYHTQSAMNNFREYTMLEMAPLEEFAGFTEEEAAGLYDEYGMDIEKAREWYDGYRLGRFGHIYNPNAIVESISRRNFKSYWTATGTYESIKKCIDMNFDGLKDKVISLLGNEKCKVNVSKFENDMVTFRNADDVLTLLIHLGYLGYDSQKEEVYIPNKEIRAEFCNAIEGDRWTKTYSAIKESRELLEATLSGDEDTVAACIEKVHMDNTSVLNYNNENSLSCVIQLAYYQAQDEYMIVREMPGGKGFADIVFIPKKGIDRPAIVVELKWNQPVETALDQIKNRQYSDRFKDYFGEVLLVGITYDKKDETKKHICKIDRVLK